MTVTIELSAEMERALKDMATARGIAVPEVIRLLLQNQLPPAQPSASPQQRADAWRASTEGLPLGPPLPDAAVARASIYS